MVSDFWSLVDAPDGAEEEEQQGARAEEVSASGGRVLRSSKVCETPTPHNEAAGRHVRWQDMSLFESLVIDMMKALAKNTISIHKLFLQVRQDSKFWEITEEKFYEYLNQVDKTAKVETQTWLGRNVPIVMEKDR